MSLPGLPPLPKSLSGFEVAQAQANNLNASITTMEQQQRMLSSPLQRQPSTLDTQLAILRREMVSQVIYVFFLFEKLVTIFFFI